MTISVELYSGLDLLEAYATKLEKHAFHPDYLTMEAFLQRSLNYAPYEIVLTNMFVEKFRYYLSKSKFRKEIDKLSSWTPKEIMLKMSPVIVGTLKKEQYLEKVHNLADGPYTAISTTDATHVYGHAQNFITHLIRQIMPHSERIETTTRSSNSKSGKVFKGSKTSDQSAYTIQKPGGLVF